jgi:hypothetical protein
MQFCREDRQPGANPRRSPARSPTLNTAGNAGAALKAEKQAISDYCQRIAQEACGDIGLKVNLESQGR